MRVKVLILTVFASLAAGAPAGAATLDDSLVAAINDARARAHVAPLHVDRALTRAARSYSAELAGKDGLVHGDVPGRLARAGAHGLRFGENLALASGALDAKAIVAAWLRSPAHRANLLHARFTRVGVATTAGGTGTVVADFAG
jgi:uncharacterized protein YkwD